MPPLTLAPLNLAEMPLPPEVVEDVFSSLPSRDPGVYAERGVGGELIINVYAAASRRILSCHVARDDADEELVRDLQAFATRRAQATRLRLA